MRMMLQEGRLHKNEVRATGGSTFCMSTLLSPSAVMPACAKPKIAPKRFTLRYPWPPQRSRHVVAVSCRAASTHQVRAYQCARPGQLVAASTDSACKYS